MKCNICPQTTYCIVRLSPLFRQASRVLQKYFVVLADELESSSPRSVQPVIVVHIHGSRHSIISSRPCLD